MYFNRYSNLCKFLSVSLKFSVTFSLAPIGCAAAVAVNVAASVAVGVSTGNEVVRNPQRYQKFDKRPRIPGKKKIKILENMNA